MKVILNLTQEQINRLDKLLYSGAEYARLNLERSEDWWDLTDTVLDAWDYQTHNITNTEE